jgi:hypothetical protein
MILDSSLTPRHGVLFDNNVKRLARPEKDRQMLGRLRRRQKEKLDRNDERRYLRSE